MTEEVLTTAQSLRCGVGRVFRAAVESCREAAEGLLMPSTCLGCGDTGGSLCPGCRSSALPAGPPMSVPTGEQGQSMVVHAAVLYEGAVAAALRGFKDQGRSDCAPFLADWLGTAVTAALEGLPQGMHSIEVLFPPSNRTKLRERGYHPVRVLLKELGLQPGVLLRLSRETEDQRAMGVTGRERNLSGAFVAPNGLAGRRFLLVDDVCTTGATLAEMARAVRQAGGSTLAAAVVARVHRRGVSRNETFSSVTIPHRRALPSNTLW